jgi:hypothetical protein
MLSKRFDLVRHDTIQLSVPTVLLFCVMAAIKKITTGTLKEAACLGFTKTHEERSKELFRIEVRLVDMMWLGHLS